jgi:hypothetical protein
MTEPVELWVVLLAMSSMWVIGFGTACVYFLTERGPT